MILPIASLVSCANQNNSSKSLYKKVNGQKIVISKDNIWGPVDKNVTDTIINTLASNLNLTNTEKSELTVNNDLKNLDSIINNKEETQAVSIKIGNKQEYASISLTWKLTNDQIPIYSIYKEWPKASSKFFESKTNYKSLLFKTLWGTGGWDPIAKEKYKELSIGGEILSPLIKIYIYS